MKGKNRAKRGIGVLVAAFLVLAVVLGALLLRKYEEAKTPPTAPTVEDKSGYQQVVLFFADAAGERLVREGREIGPCDEVAACLEEILEELINGPVSDLVPVLPVTGMFNSVQLSGDVAIVDFARELLDALPSGSSSEMMAAYAIVNSLTFNYPQVRRVQFTLDGKPLETLKGHLDMRAPLVPDFSLEKSGEPAASPKGTKQ